MKNRLAIFVFYDKDGKVDRYVEYLLDQLKQNVTDIVCLSNCELEKEQIDKLSKYCSKVVVRENKGLDGAAYKQGLVKEVGWEKAETYDDVIIVNDTFYGPFIPFKTIFDEMDSRNVDFWGLSFGPTAVDGYKRVKYGYIPDHIQTFFVSFSKKMVKSKAFKNYWNNYDDTMNTFVDVVTQHEMVMTKYFQDRGFKWSTFANIEELKSSDIRDNYTAYAYEPYNMMTKYNFPFLKRKCLSYDVADQHYIIESNDVEKCLEYIKNNTNYDVSMIYENALRIYNISDFYNCLHLNRIIEEKQVKDISKAAALIWLSNPKLEKYIVSKIKETVADIPVYLVFEYKPKYEKDLPNNVVLLASTKQDSEMNAYIKYANTLFQKHEYICFMHDFVGSYPMLPNNNSIDIMIDNMVRNKEYIQGVIDLFEENDNLGIMGLPQYMHNDSFGNVGNTWGPYFTKTKKFVNELKLNVNIQEIKSPLLIDGIFWARKGVLDDMLDGSLPSHEFYSDRKDELNYGNEAARRLVSYVAQANGYYTMTIMNKEFAEMRLTNLNYFVDQNVAIDRNELKCFPNVEAIFLRYKKEAIKNYSGENGDVVIAGVRPALAARIRRKHKGLWGKFLIRILGLKKY